MSFAQQAGVYFSCQDSPPEGPYFINVKVWVAHDNNGNGPSIAQVNTTLTGVDAFFSPHNIFFNYCIQYVVDESIIQDPDIFLFGNCGSVVYDDPDRIDILLITPPNSQQSAGEADELGGDKAWSFIPASNPNNPNPGNSFTMAHELAHLLSLIHTHGDPINTQTTSNCVTDVPNHPNWTPGNALSNKNQGDFVQDTPVHPVSGTGSAFTSTMVYNLTSCTINWGASPDNCSGNFFPSDYDGNRTLEQNIMAQEFPGCAIMTRNFTAGQGERMRCYIEQDKQEFLSDGEETCTTIANICINLSGDITNDIDYTAPCYNITSDLNIIGANVRFINSKINVLNSANGALSSINVRNGSTFVLRNTNCGYDQCNTWGSLSVDNDGTLNIFNSYVGNCNELNFRTSLQLQFGKSMFKNINTINIERSNPSLINDCAFDNCSLIDISSTKINMPGTKFNNCRIVASRSDLNFIASDKFVPAFYSSSIEGTNLDLIIDDAYFDENSGPVTVNGGGDVMVCRSEFDNCRGGNWGILDISDVSNYLIFHNYFKSDGNNTCIGVGSSGSGLIQNNIFSGAADDINNFDDNVDISCNFHEGANFAWNNFSGNLIDQGNEDHPAGNVFDGVTHGIQNFGSSFNYYFNEDNPLEEPSFVVNDFIVIPAKFDAFGANHCQPRSAIMRLFDFRNLCFPNYWTNWPECDETWCIAAPEGQAPNDCNLPTPTRLNGRVINDRDDTAIENVRHTSESDTKNATIESRNQNDEIVVWPNPVSDIIQIKNNSKNLNTILLYDANGKIIKEVNSQNSKTDISINDIPSGVYTLVVLSQDGIQKHIQKIIKL